MRKLLKAGEDIVALMALTWSPTTAASKTAGEA